MIGLSGYLGPGEAEPIREAIVDYLLSHPGEVANECSKNQPADVKAEAVVTMAQALQVSTLFLWRTDIFRSAVSGVEVFVGRPCELPGGFPKFSLHIPSASMRMQSGMAFCGMHMAQLEDGILLACFFIPYIPLSTPFTDGREDWVRVRYGWLKPGEPLQRWGALSMSMLEFLRTKYVTHEPWHYDRAERRRAEKQKRKLPDVRVVYLRRPERHVKPGEHGHVDYDCQFWVSGHWREQWFPKLGVHKPVYVGSYIKGPPDKPLRPPRKTVYFATR